MYGLADCNNFFVSCERVFNPGLEGRPVIVLSNNDGCVIARSNEAKALGIKMGQPFYQIREQARRNGVTIFSANNTLHSLGNCHHRFLNGVFKSLILFNKRLIDLFNMICIRVYRGF